jgi:hypothetical protein
VSVLFSKPGDGGGDVIESPLSAVRLSRRETALPACVQITA